MSYQTDQEAFWAGSFGDEYISRNQDETLRVGNLAFFGEVLRHCGKLSSVIELGANIGLNLIALRQFLSEAELAAVEINALAVESLQALSGVTVHHASLLEFESSRAYDLSFTKGVLIHIAPEMLSKAYDALYQASSRYILIAEYYNTTPVEVTYRGHEGRLFKRDFAGEMLDRFPDLALRHYGFAWRRDPIMFQGDLTWFLLEKKAV